MLILPVEMAADIGCLLAARRKITAVKRAERWFAGLRQTVVADTSWRADPPRFPVPLADPRAGHHGGDGRHRRGPLPGAARTADGRVRRVGRSRPPRAQNPGDRLRHRVRPALGHRPVDRDDADHLPLPARYRRGRPGRLRPPLPPVPGQVHHRHAGARHAYRPQPAARRAAELAGLPARRRRRRASAAALRGRPARLHDRLACARARADSGWPPTASTAAGPRTRASGRPWPTGTTTGSGRAA